MLRSNMLISALALLLPMAASAANQQTIVRAHVYDSATGAPVANIPVKIGYWHCILVIGCKLKPLTEGITDVDGNAELSIKNRATFYVSIESCPGDFHNFGTQLTNQGQIGPVDVRLAANIKTCKEDVEALKKNKEKGS